MNEVVEIKVLQDFRIEIKFNDGELKTVNFKPFLGKGFTKELLNFEKFKQVYIEPGGGIAWENGFDFCPNFLKELEGEPTKV
ncbi:MAG TPA: DUF2442 domain-containing protein [Cryomorphaceae bacterium]|nr:DUF2442 domain-containing protein [Cryomorphaceae bacterium]